MYSAIAGVLFMSLVTAGDATPLKDYPVQQVWFTAA
jgi:hypothetical protein